MQGLYIALLVLAVSMSAAVDPSPALECGYPGAPAHGKVHTFKKIFKPGDAVTFVCDDGYFLFGPMERVCLSDGTWSGRIPLCDSSLPLDGHLATSSSTLSLHPASFSIDGSTQTCTYTKKSRTRWIRVNMTSLYKIRAVTITFPYDMPKQESQSFGIFAIQVNNSSTKSYHLCARFNGTIPLNKLTLPCEEEGRYIHIEVARHVISNFALCEIQIFVHKSRYECGIPEQPAHSYNLTTDGKSVEYRCLPGYKLLGNDSRHCMQDGQWSHSQPICQGYDTQNRVHACPDLPIPKAGSVKYLSAQQRTAISRARNSARVSSRSGANGAQRIPARALETATAEPYMISLHPGSHPVGSKAVIECESKYYQLFGSRTRRCQETGQWSGRPTICLPVCGRSESTSSPFIINGNATDIGQWPWQAGIALEDYEGWTMACGASLLNELWVITAAHCVTYKHTASIIEPDEFQVYLGKYYRNDTKDDEYVQIRKIQEIHVHPDYDPRTYDADIALIQLDSPVELTYRVQPICLPTEQTARKNLVEGQKGIVTGWGVNENSTFSETLRQAVLPVVSHANCEKGLEEAGYQVTITDNMFCAGYKGGSTDTCYGDSGGPVVFADECTNSGKWVLEGIIGWGINCGFQNQYGGYTTVSKFLDWIHQYI